jgi:ribosome recycling factor
MPLNQVATVSTPEARMLSVQVWDRSNVSRSRRRSARPGLGLNPITDGQMIRLPIPELTEERRKELAKLVGQYAEKARIAVRNVRRDGMDHLKQDEKKHEISEDERKRLEHEVQKLTDDTIKEIDELARRQGKGNPRQVTSSTAPEEGAGNWRERRRQHGPAPRRDHHGRQRPLGEAARAAARRRPPRGRRSGPPRAAGGRRPRRRGADALRFLVGELAAQRRGDLRPHRR